MNTPEPTAQTTEQQSQYWSLNRASKELGINKSTLSTDASKGKLQWHPQPDGTKKFFAPELYNLYRERIAKRTERAERVLNTGTNPETEQDKPSQNKELNTALEVRSEMVDILKAQIDDLRHDRDQWRKQAEATADQLTEALTVIKALPAPVPVVAEPKRKKFLGLF